MQISVIAYNDNVEGIRKQPNGKYIVGIGYSGQRKHIGTYETYEEAKQARLIAEETYQRK